MVRIMPKFTENQGIYAQIIPELPRYSATFARISSEVKRAPRRQKQAIWAEIRPKVTKNPYRNTLNQPRVVFSGKHQLYLA